MACPVTIGGGAFLLITGLYTVFFQDRRYYRIWWTVLLGLIAGWTAYYTLFDRAAIARYTLEAISLVYFVILEIRLLQLVVRDGLRPPGTRLLTRLTQACTPYTLNPVSVMLKTFILTMIGLEYIGKTEFSWHWYVVSSVLLLAWFLVLAFGGPLLRGLWLSLIVRVPLLQRLFTKPAENGSDEGGCPLGYGKSDSSSATHSEDDRE